MAFESFSNDVSAVSMASYIFLGSITVSPYSHTRKILCQHIAEPLPFDHDAKPPDAGSERKSKYNGRCSSYFAHMAKELPELRSSKLGNVRDLRGDISCSLPKPPAVLNIVQDRHIFIRYGICNLDCRFYERWERLFFACLQSSSSGPTEFNFV